MATKLQIRRDTAANWASANPTLSSGELGFETDTYKLKIGNGSTAWNSLNYYDDQFSGLDSADTIRLLGLGVVKHIIPAGNELYDLGDSDNRFRDLYLSGNTLKLGDATLTASNATLQLPSTVQIGTTTLTSLSNQSISIGEDSAAGTILDSASVLQLINAAYIQANQITYNTNDFVDSAYVTTQINNLIDGAPGTLDTLNEIAAALNDDAAAYDTLLSLINAKTDYDSADTLGLIDSDYIQLRRPAETIMTVTGDGANYYFTGDGFPSTSSGDPTLYLTRGKTYQFEGISGSHPFEIRQSAGGSAYSTGVTNNGGSGTVIFTVPMNAPTSLVYQCTVHSGMVGDIVILDNTTGGSGGLDSAAVTTLIDSAYVQARQTSGGSGTVDSAQVVSIINNNTNSGFVWYSYTATQGQTTFQDSDNSGKVLSYDPNGIAVFYNGVLLTPNDFTASDQSSVVLGTAADSGENIAIFKWGVGYVAPVFPWGGNRGVIAGGGTASIEYITIASPSNASSFGSLTTSRSNQGGSGASDSTYGLCIIGGGSNAIEYITFSTLGNATSFGTLTSVVNRPTSVSNATYGISGSGDFGGYKNTIEYVTIASPGNATDFGDLTVSADGRGSANDATYGLWGAGYSGGTNPTIDYITMATPSNATDFGDVTQARFYVTGSHDETYAVFAGGTGGGYKNTMDYVTTATPSNATDFGDLTRSKYGMAGGMADGTYGVFAGGNNGSNLNDIEYITIASPSNATDFGDLTTSRSATMGTAGDS